MSEASCARSLVKLAFLLVNLLLIILSLAVLLFGAQLFLAEDADHGGKGKGTNLNQNRAIGGHKGGIDHICIIVGLLLGVVSLLGFSAAFNESPFFLRLYAYLLIVIFCFLGFLYGYVQLCLPSSSVLKKARQLYRAFMANYGRARLAQKLVHTLQMALLCCGDEGPSDWHNGSLLALPNEIIPLVHEGSLLPVPDSYYPVSCCGQQLDSIRQICPTWQLLYPLGCFSQPQLQSYLLQAHAFFYTSMSAVLLVISIACCLQADPTLEEFKLVNLKYAANRVTCRAGQIVLGSPASRQVPNTSDKPMGDGSHQLKCVQPCGQLFEK